MINLEYKKSAIRHIANGHNLLVQIANEKFIPLCIEAGVKLDTELFISTALEISLDMEILLIEFHRKKTDELDDEFEPSCNQRWLEIQNILLRFSEISSHLIFLSGGIQSYLKSCFGGETIDPIGDIVIENGKALLKNPVEFYIKVCIEDREYEDARKLDPLD